jgi:hypothetical protein
MATLEELARYRSMQDWRLTGRDAIAKVISQEEAIKRSGTGSIATLGLKGYITISKYLFGLNAPELERALGLPPLSLNSGACIYMFTRLPTYDEVDFKYSLAWPDGKVPTAAEYADLISRRDANYAASVSDPSLYPPGGAHIPQWRLRFDRSHLGILGNLTQIVTATTPFRRDNGSTKLFSPHNRRPNWGGIL